MCAHTKKPNNLWTLAMGFGFIALLLTLCLGKAGIFDVKASVPVQVNNRFSTTTVVTGGVRTTVLVDQHTGIACYALASSITTWSCAPMTRNPPR